ncbi:MAG: gamma-glutamylcyclotransferase family protein [Burkholderiaceae bacterium]
MSSSSLPSPRAVFTYGSLMFPSVWTAVVRGRYPSRRAWLHGFRRYAVRGEAYPAAVRDPDARIAGRLYLDVDADDLARLDAFEGAEYERITVPVQRIGEGGQADATVDAELYLFLPADRIDRRDWDPVWFESEGLTAFSRQYRPPSDG